MNELNWAIEIRILCNKCLTLGRILDYYENDDDPPEYIDELLVEYAELEDTLVAIQEIANMTIDETDVIVAQNVLTGLVDENLVNMSANDALSILGKKVF